MDPSFPEALLLDDHGMMLLAMMRSMMSTMMLAMLLARVNTLMGNGLDEERSRLGGLEHVLHHEEGVRLGAIMLVLSVPYDRTLSEAVRHVFRCLTRKCIRMLWKFQSRCGAVWDIMSVDRVCRLLLVGMKM